MCDEKEEITEDAEGLIPTDDYEKGYTDYTGTVECYMHLDCSTCIYSEVCSRGF